MNTLPNRGRIRLEIGDLKNIITENRQLNNREPMN